MKLLSDKEKVYLEKELKPVALSFSRDLYEDGDAINTNTILFYLNCVDSTNPDKGRCMIDVLEICTDSESITFNYYLSKEQIRELINLILCMSLDGDIDKYVVNGLYKLVAVMCIQYKYDQSEVDKVIGSHIEIKDGLFSEIVNSISMYFEKYNGSYISSKFKMEKIDDDAFDAEEDDTLEENAVNYNEIEYKFDPAIGREDEIKDALVSLMQGSCILVGEPGVGKTAIAEGIAYRIKNGLVPDSLSDKVLYGVTATELVSSCRYVGDLEEKMRDLLNDVMLRENVILFFDEMHTAIGTGKGSDGTLDIANIIKPYLDRGQIKMIGATTKDEYDEHISKDPAFRRRLEKLVIKEPEDDKLYLIIDSYIDGEVVTTDVNFDDEKINRDLLIKKLIELTGKPHRNYIDIEYNPGLVISIIKKAFSYAMYYDHKDVELSDIVEAVEKCSYLYQPVKDRFKDLEKTLVKKDKEKVLSKRIVAFNKR